MFYCCTGPGLQTARLEAQRWTFSGRLERNVFLQDGTKCSQHYSGRHHIRLRLVPCTTLAGIQVKRITEAPVVSITNACKRESSIYFVFTPLLFYVSLRTIEYHPRLFPSIPVRCLPPSTPHRASRRGETTFSTEKNRRQRYHHGAPPRWPFPSRSFDGAFRAAAQEEASHHSLPSTGSSKSSSNKRACPLL